MRTRSRLVIVVIALWLLLSQSALTVYAYGGEDWYITPVRLRASRCDAGGYLFSTAFSGMSTTQSYRYWIVVADGPDQLVASRYWETWASPAVVPPAVSATGNVALYPYTNPYPGGLNANQPVNGGNPWLPSSTDLYVQISLVQGIWPYATQTARVYRFQCQSSAAPVLVSTYLADSPLSMRSMRTGSAIMGQVTSSVPFPFPLSPEAAGSR